MRLIVDLGGEQTLEPSADGSINVVQTITGDVAAVIRPEPGAVPVIEAPTAGDAPGLDADARAVTLQASDPSTFRVEAEVPTGTAPLCVTEAEAPAANETATLEKFDIVTAATAASTNLTAAIPDTAVAAAASGTACSHDARYPYRWDNKVWGEGRLSCPAAAGVYWKTQFQVLIQGTTVKKSAWSGKLGRFELLHRVTKNCAGSRPTVWGHQSTVTATSVNRPYFRTSTFPRFQQINCNA